MVGLCMVLSIAAGCAPQNIGRYNEIAFGAPKRVSNDILDTHDDWYMRLGYWIQGEVEEPEDFPGPVPGDLTPPVSDYILGSGDLIEVTILDLFQQGVPYVQRVRISEEGNISLPYLQSVAASGLSARGLEEKLRQMLRPDYLQNPRVSVFVAESRNRFYTVLGAVARPGVYDLPSLEWDLLKAIGQAGNVNPFAEEYAYMVRTMSQQQFEELLLRAYAETPEQSTSAPAAERQGTVPGDVSAAGGQPDEAEARPAAEVEKLSDLEVLQRVAQGESVPAEAIEGASDAAATEAQADIEAPTEPEPAAEADEGEWVFKDDRWVRVQPAGGEAEAAPAGEQPTAADEGDAGADGMAEAPSPGEQVDIAELPAALRKRLERLGVVQGGEGLKRIIRIDVPSLLALDPTQNVIVRPDDVIHIPSPPAGEWYIDGEVVRRGVYSLTGRKITVLQAVAAAGGLTQLAIPQRTELVRRVGDNSEEIIYVDLAKIARGEAPDFYLQPEDLIRVGTDQGAIFLAVLRNSFRSTWGFGLVYDQNFADIYPWKGEIHPLF